MEIMDSKKAYIAPQIKVVEVNVQGLLCSSPEENDRQNWENGGDI